MSTLETQKTWKDKESDDDRIERNTQRMIDIFEKNND